MFRFLLICLVAIGLTSHADARQRGGAQNASASASFVGVIDQESTVTAFWGSVPGSAALATSLVTLFDLSNNSTTCTGVKATVTGGVDVSTGTYCNGNTQTVTAWCSTNCVSGGTARITKLYNQKSPGTGDATAAYGVAADFILSGVAGKPTIGCVSARSSQYTATVTALTSGQSYGATLEITANWGNSGGILSDGASFFIGGGSVANSMDTNFFVIGSGDVQITGLTDGTGPTDFTPAHFHRILAVSPTGTAAVNFYADGALGASSAAVGGPNNSATTMMPCGQQFSSIDANFTNTWIDSTPVSSGVANAVTNKTTVPLP